MLSINIRFVKAGSAVFADFSIMRESNRAHFRREAPETGLSACIFFAIGKKGYRFYPLRGRKPAAFAFQKWPPAIFEL
jgi:hypothetical protein